VESIWRDMKVIDGFVYIGSEADGHGLQIFDMRKLLALDAPKTFSIATDLTAHFAGFGSSHNIVANEATNFIYAVGTAFCGKGGLFFVDVSDPAKPRDAGCAAEDGYVHDAQCVIYEGPHKAYRGKEICFGYNEDTLTIYDVTDKSKPSVPLSRRSDCPVLTGAKKVSSSPSPATMEPNTRTRAGLLATR
jgi:choice-of-anchor B domain-containing protein